MNKTLKTSRNLFALCYIIFIMIFTYSLGGERLGTSNKITTFVFLGLFIFCFIGAIVCHMAMLNTKPDPRDNEETQEVE